VVYWLLVRYVGTGVCVDPVIFLLTVVVRRRTSTYSRGGSVSCDNAIFCQNPNGHLSRDVLVQVRSQNPKG
jgi:hypothetical protein